ncbi:hypothetical protein BST97_08025 [Nonlabens spongiae]|uniref:Uncharacterized protein n=1 Tax=Nonlabens spongiae TaxID=331648 RepID=A0A1W6MK10_9FLAO|nr:hypothetical protein [Nonlabens spongiae]ARN77948.1 hypothetical protein BST97_08025 [Nonlabens spongiae]
MIANTVIPFTSNAGSQYLIKLSLFESGLDFDIPVMDVSITLVEKAEKVVSLSDLINICYLIKDYLMDNRVVLYYYCDHGGDDIFISERNSFRSPQNYRSNLFERLFDFLDTENYVRDQIIIGDEDSNDAHFISLISREEDKSHLTDISIQVQKMNDK